MLPSPLQGDLPAALPALSAEAQREKDMHVLALGGGIRQGTPVQGTQLLVRRCSAAVIGTGQVLQDRLW